MVILDNDQLAPQLLLQLDITSPELAVILYGDSSPASIEATMVLLTDNHELIATEMHALFLKLLKQRKEASYGLTRILQLRR